MLAELADEGFVGEELAFFGAALHVVGVEDLAGEVFEAVGDVPFAFLVELLADVVEDVFLELGVFLEYVDETVDGGAGYLAVVEVYLEIGAEA